MAWKLFKNKSGNFLHPIFKKHKLTLGQRASDMLTRSVGSWAFIIILFIIMGIWMFLNIYFIFFNWDPYPFILLNFVLSMLAAIQAPIILMSQNREAHRDRLQAKYDYDVNKKAEKEIRQIQKDLNEVKELLMKRSRKR